MNIHWSSPFAFSSHFSWDVYEIQARWINSVEPNSMTPSAMRIQDIVRSPCLWPWRVGSTTSLPGSPPWPTRWGSNSWKLDVGHCQRLSCHATIPWAGRTRRNRWHCRTLWRDSKCALTGNWMACLAPSR